MLGLRFDKRLAVKTRKCEDLPATPVEDTNLSYNKIQL